MLQRLAVCTRPGLLVLLLGVSGQLAAVSLVAIQHQDFRRTDSLLVAIDDQSGRISEVSGQVELILSTLGSTSVERLESSEFQGRYSELVQDAHSAIQAYNRLASEYDRHLKILEQRYPASFVMVWRWLHGHPAWVEPRLYPPWPDLESPEWLNMKIARDRIRFNGCFFLLNMVDCAHV